MRTVRVPRRLASRPPTSADFLFSLAEAANQMKWYQIPAVRKEISTAVAVFLIISVIAVTAGLLRHDYFNA
jgi:hypothetical protein